MPDRQGSGYGGAPIGAMHELTWAVADTPPGQSRTLKVWRDGQERTLTVRIDALETSKRTSDGKAPAGAFGGTTMDAGLGRHLAETLRGPVIRMVDAGSAADEVGPRAGDRLLRIDQSSVASARDAQAAVERARTIGRSAVLLQIERIGSKLFIGVPLAS